MRHSQSTAVLLLIVSCMSVGGPASAAVDVDDIVKRASDALRADWAADPSYACIERDQLRRGDKVTSKTFEVVMIDGSEYHFPLATDGQPLSPARHRAEQKKLKMEIERRKNESESARRLRIEAWKRQRNESGELLLDFPSALTFQFVGEEVKDGHPAYALAATPKAGVVPTTRTAKVLTGIEGKVWVEKESLHPMDVECRVIRPVPVYGPLASVLPGTDIEIKMTQVTASTWLIDLVSMKLNVSKLHLWKSGSVSINTYTRYRPNAAAVADLVAEAGQQ